MKVIWSDFASETLHEIFVYHKEVAGKDIAKKITSAIFSTTKQLVKYPKSGQIEYNLTSLGENHRYMLIRNYKVIYRPIKEGLLITDIFDTRQDPKKINVKSLKSSGKTPGAL